MKNIFYGILIIAATFESCNGSNDKASAATQSTDTAKEKKQTEHNNIVTASAKTGNNSIKDIVSNYLYLKNDFTNDNSAAAAKTALALGISFKDFNKTSLTEPQKKMFEELSDDVSEHTEHIGKNAGNIKHQREHFEMLSKDIYDLVKSISTEQVLYRDFCPMYNDGKGAYWISETKEINNPYFGKKMSSCGSVKEEIK